MKSITKQTMTADVAVIYKTQVLFYLKKVKIAEAIIYQAALYELVASVQKL